MERNCANRLKPKQSGSFRRRSEINQSLKTNYWPGARVTRSNLHSQKSCARKPQSPCGHLACGRANYRTKKP
jgi:hypothetical protein